MIQLEGFFVLFCFCAVWSRDQGSFSCYMPLQLFQCLLSKSCFFFPVGLLRQHSKRTRRRNQTVPADSEYRCVSWTSPPFQWFLGRCPPLVITLYYKFCSHVLSMLWRFSTFVLFQDCFASTMFFMYTQILERTCWVVQKSVLRLWLSLHQTCRGTRGDRRPDELRLPPASAVSLPTRLRLV